MAIFFSFSSINCCRSPITSSYTSFETMDEFCLETCLSNLVLLVPSTDRSLYRCILTNLYRHRMFF